MKDITIQNESLNQLMQGNKRYVDSRLIHPDQSIERRLELKHGQHPFAIILSCSDSRVPPEVIFDQGLGSLFVIRVAGNVLDPIITASIEYAVLHLNVALIVVMGHSKCGAVGAACQHAQLEGQLPNLMSALSPALDKAKDLLGDFVQNAMVANVKNVVDELEQTGANFSVMVNTGKLTIVPTYYDIDTGVVNLV